MPLAIKKAIISLSRPKKEFGYQNQYGARKDILLVVVKV
jgi:hypothetical protein